MFFYSSPILRRGVLVGRGAAKAHRKAGEFELRSVHLEPGVRLGKRLAAALEASGTVGLP